MFRKIIWQLIFSYLFVILFTMGIMGIFLLTSLESHFISNIKSTLLFNAQVISKFWGPYFFDKSLTMREKRLVSLMTERLAWQSACRIRVIDKNSLVLADTGKKPHDSFENPVQVERAMYGEESTLILPPDDQNPSSVISISYPIKIAKGSPSQDCVVGVVYITRSLIYIKEILSSIRKEYGIGILISLLTLGLLSIFLSAYISGPIREMTKAAEKIAEGDLKYKVPHKRSDEIGQLADRFDYMREKLRITLEELLKEKNKLSAILSNMADGVLVFDRDRRIILINNTAFRLLGNSEIKKMMECFNSELAPYKELKNIIDNALQSGEGIVESIRGFHENRVVETSVSPLKSEHDEFIGLVMILHDITELQRLDEMKTEFVTNVSHELKTPLASIKGFAELLLDGAVDDSEKAESFLMAIDKEVDRLTRLVRGLLDLSKMESGLLKMEIYPVDVSSLIKGVLSKMSLQAKNNNVNIKAEFKANPIALGNSDRLEQVLFNLLDNGLRYSPEGSTISVSLNDVDGMIRTKICDEGPGLSFDDQKRVFDRFYRVDKARSRDHGGSGLGLAITRQIIENLGGRIWVESEPGFGCCFIFTLNKADSESMTK